MEGFFKRVRLRVGVALAFVLVMVPLIGGMVGYLYRSNSTLALQMASQSMDAATQGIVDNIQTLLAPVARVVEATALQAQSDPSSLRRLAGLRPLFERLDQMPQVYSYYFAFARDGTFYQAVHLPPGLTTFGPNRKAPPPGAPFVVRLLDASSGEMADSYIYKAKWGDIARVERGAVNYDPRVRPWFKAATAAKSVSLSEVYPFASTGTAGVTLSCPARTDDGVLIGVAGADIALDTLGAFLAKKRIGEHGAVFVMDREGRLVGHPDPKVAVRAREGQIELVKAAEAADPIVRNAVMRRQAGAGDRFRAPLGPDGDEYLVAFTPFSAGYGNGWTIGVAVQLNDLVGPLQTASLRILAAGLAAIALMIAAILWLSRVLTARLQTMVAETERIRNFDLAGDFRMRSRIIEIDDLARAVAAMKSSLVSFGAYVPKALVKSILSSGTTTSVGGSRRPLTVMFSDIEDFTRSSESLAPETVLANLSAYFAAMSTAIHTHGGTIDKFIGDAIMAMWNAPVPDPDHVANACRAMLTCRDANRRLNDDFVARGLPPMRTRFGLHTGEMVVGNVGAHDRMQYTALGADVNLASRVEGLNKFYRTQLLVTEPVENAVRGRFLFRYVDLVVPVGISRPIALYELVGENDAGANHPATEADRVLCAEWTEALKPCHARDWHGALASIRAFLGRHPDDALGAVWRDRCQRYIDHPPPLDWDGAQQFKRK